MRSTLRRTALAAVTGTLLVTGSASSALALPGDGGDDDPFNCTTSVSATMTASATNIDSGTPVTIGWSVTAPAACTGEVTYKVGSSFTFGTAVGKTGSKVYTPTTGTTYHLYADFGDHYKALASRTVLMKNEIPLTIDLTTFKALDVQEEGLLSTNGDEPWLVVVPIIADGRTVDYANLAGSGSRMYRATKSHENLGHLGVDDGDTFAVPASVGEFHTTLQPWRNLPTTEGKKAATVGVVVVALEEDLSSDAVADTVSSLVALAIKGEVDNLVKAGTAPTESGLAQWRADIADAVTEVAFDQAYRNLDLPGLADPDDIIGVGFQAVTQAELEAAGPGGRLVNLTLIGDGAGYGISGVIRRG